MGHSKTARKLIFLLFIMLPSCRHLLSAGDASKAERRTTVKVGVLNDTTYADQDENGNWKGLDIECMIAVAQKAGFDLTFIDSSCDPDFLGSLANGTYDIIADVIATPERAEKFLFTDEPIGHTTNTLAVRSDDDRWDYGNIEQISSMKIGLVASYANNGEFRRWCRKHAVTPDITEYHDIGQMTAALLDGSIDGEVYIALYDTGNSTSLRTVMKFLLETFYYAFRKDDTSLKNKVDEALAQILAGNADYLTNLKNKYEAAYNVNILPFSTAEKRYIEAHPVLTVAVLDNDEPYYSSAPGGPGRGILCDYYALAAEGTGMQFRYNVYATQDDAVAAVKNGDADILGIFSGGIIQSQKYGIALTDSFYTVDNILLTKAGTALAQIRVVAVAQKKKASLSDNIRKELPGVEIRIYETTNLCFDALSRGAVDAVAAGHPSATWLMNQRNANAYNIIPIPYAANELCAAVNRKDLLLCSILNKRFGSTRGSFTGIVMNDTLPADDWLTVISRVPPGLVVIIISILTVLVIGLAWMLVILRQRQKERVETEKRAIQMEAIQKNAEQQSRFFANMSHDMRTPLNAVLGFVRLAKKDGIASGQREEYLEKAESSGVLMLDLINDTLTMSKASSGKLELHPAVVDTASLGRTIITPIQTLAAEKHITFSLDTSRYRSRSVVADHLALQKIFLNILNNAVKYTPENGHISVTAYDDPEDSASPDSVVVVSDDGIGISQEFLPHVFEPFMQEQRPGYDSVGTGLGLSIVRQLVDLMGGTIAVQSEKDRGTTFTLRLHLPEAAGQAAVQDHAEEPADDLSGKKVLLCEDNALNREIAVALLKDKGITTVEAENGEIGVQKFLQSAANEYSLILMDIRMPVMDGIEAAEKIRSLDRPDAKTIPIIAMTADAFESDVQRCLDAGMNAHIAKPVNPAQLYQAIKKQ